MSPHPAVRPPFSKGSPSVTSLDASDGSPTGDHPGGDGRLTVLIGADTFFPDVNGAARFAERLAAGLVARGHDVHVMAPSKTWAQHGVFREVIVGGDPPRNCPSHASLRNACYCPHWSSWYRQT